MVRVIFQHWKHSSSQKTSTVDVVMEEMHSIEGKVFLQRCQKPPTEDDWAQRIRPTRFIMLD